jgi:hypothetical protein
MHFEGFGGKALKDSKLVASLDVVMSLLANPRWSRRAKDVKNLGEMKQILLEYCAAEGKVVRVDQGLVYLYP